MRVLRIALAMLIVCPSVPAGAQTASSTAEAEVAAVVAALFDAMRAGDGAAVAGLFAPGARLSSVVRGDDGASVSTGDPADFANAVGAPRADVWDERVSGLEVRVDGDLATAWMNYSFHLGDRFSHCGVNAFQLVRLREGWRILQITDTRRQSDCG